MTDASGRQGSGISVPERVRPGRPATAPPVQVESCPVRHCWVFDAADGRGVRRPGLLVEWRQVGAGWEGRVVYAAQLRADAWTLVEEWLPAALLTPL